MATEAGPDAMELRHRIVKTSADFARAFLRWTDATECDGISYHRLRLLEQLHCVGPDKMRVLGEELGLTPRNMTALVDAMQQEGLVVRCDHPTDRRAVLVELTPAGLAAADALLEPRIEAMAALFEDLSVDEQEQFLVTLERLLTALRSRGVRT